MNKALHFILVQHARCAWDASWCPIEQGILDAARELHVTVTLLGPNSGRTIPRKRKPCGRCATPCERRFSQNYSRPPR